jgi:hypothetical protein
VAPVGPCSPVGGPTHFPVLSITVVPLIDTLVGVMSPFTFPATSAYGTLKIACRGVISGSALIFTPRYFGFPSNTDAGMVVVSPRIAEKYPSSSVMVCVSAHSTFALAFGPS